MFRKTGRNISVSRDELINIVIDKLHIYDNASPQNRKNMSNPYRDVVYTNTKEGKMVQVPSDIHEDAIQEWTQSKQNVNEQHKEQNNTAVYHNELDKLRQYESNKYNDVSSRGELPRDHDLYRKVYTPKPDESVVDGVVNTNQNYETRDFQEPENIQRYMNNEKKEEECLTCNTGYDHKYVASGTQHTPYVNNMNDNMGNDYGDDYDDGDDYGDDYCADYTDKNANNYYTNNNDNMYKYLFYLVLLALLFVIYRNRNNNEQIFNL